jgi:hypothetical protein
MSRVQKGLESLEKPGTVVLLTFNALLWMTLCVDLILRWNLLPGAARYCTILLAVAFAQLVYSVVRDNDKLSNLFWVSVSFGTTILSLAVYRFR